MYEINNTKKAFTSKKGKKKYTLVVLEIKGNTFLYKNYFFVVIIKRKAFAFKSEPLFITNKLFIKACETNYVLFFLIKYNIPYIVILII
jgi:hypothetical protein